MRGSHVIIHVACADQQLVMMPKQATQVAKIPLRPIQYGNDPPSNRSNPFGPPIINSQKFFSDIEIRDSFSCCAI